MNSKQLWNKRREVEASVAAFVAAGETDNALRAEGELRQIDAQLEAALAQEEEERIAGAARAATVTGPETSFGQLILGPEASFAGIDEGFRASAPVQNAVSGLPTPQIYKTDLKDPYAPPMGFLETIPKGTTDGDEHFFKQPVLTNKAAGWTSGNKPESSLAWSEGVAHIEVIAHHMPILKQTARRYKQLEGIVSKSLMLGLDMKANEYALFGSNTSGIVGVTNTTGILVHGRRTGKNLRDEFCTMKRKVRVASGLPAGYVCLSPYALETLYQEKDKNDRYLYDELERQGTIMGLTPIEDVSMTVTTTTGEGESAVTKTVEKSLVYYNMGASFDIADPQEVSVGLVANQFIQNAYTLLGEMTAALRVDIPSAFCLCENLGIAAESE